MQTKRVEGWALALGTCLAFSMNAGVAQACGGLFCSNAAPVNQAAERIIFAKNDDGTVTAAIEIQYEGPTHEFAWVLPVPDGDVTVGVSSKIAFDRIQAQSNPFYTLNVSFESCDANAKDDSGSAPGQGDATPGADPSEPRDADVTIVDQGNAGPYDYLIISVNEDLDDRADVAVEWLQDNGYDVADIGPETLRPYLDDGLNLIAFRLSKGQDAGSIRPVMITYESDEPSIPILPTAVAANPDMGILVWVLGDSRAIPNNYFDLELNEAMINWFNPSPTYNDVITAAADEAGGHGFVTEQSGAAGQFAEAAYADYEQYWWEELRTGSFESISEFLEFSANLFGSYDGFPDLIRDAEVLPLRDGATPEQFMQCIRCYFETDVAVRNEAYPSTPYDAETDPLATMDVLAFLDRMEELVITPLADTRALFEDHESVTRLYTTLSPAEMTIDPGFQFNPELPDIDNVHVAEQIFQCGGSEWRVELPQGMTLYGDGGQWPVSLDDAEMPVNFRIVQLSEEGEGDVVENNAASIGGLLVDLGVGEPGGGMMGAMDAMDAMDPVGMGGVVEPDDSNDGVNTDGSDANAASGSGGCQLSANSVATAFGGAWWLLGAAALLRRRRGTKLAS